jgi:hypothetical protein
VGAGFEPAHKLVNSQMPYRLAAGIELALARGSMSKWNGPWAAAYGPSSTVADSKNGVRDVEVEARRHVGPPSSLQSGH